MNTQTERPQPVDYPLHTLTARELIGQVDRSHPQVDALAGHLERLLDGLEALKHRLGKHGDQARDIEDHAGQLTCLYTPCKFTALPD